MARFVSKVSFFARIVVKSFQFHINFLAPPVLKCFIFQFSQQNIVWDSILYYFTSDNFNYSRKWFTIFDDILLRVSGEKILLRCIVWRQYVIQ